MTAAFTMQFAHLPILSSLLFVACLFRHAALMVFRASADFHAWLLPLSSQRPQGEPNHQPFCSMPVTNDTGKRDGNRKLASPFQLATRECGTPRRFLTPHSSYMPFGGSPDQVHYSTISEYWEALRGYGGASVYFFGAGWYE